jgi:polyadenylate-binding protein
VNAWADLAKPRVRIPSEGTAQASSSVAQEIGLGNEVQQDSHRSHTDAPRAIDRSERNEVRIPSEGTAQASSSVAQEIGLGNEVQQDSHRSHTDAPSAIDRSERSETSCKPYNGGPRESSSPGDRNAVSHSVGRKKQFPSPERLNTGTPSGMSYLNHFSSSTPPPPTFYFLHLITVCLLDSSISRNFSRCCS